MRAAFNKEFRVCLSWIISASKVRIESRLISRAILNTICQVSQTLVNVFTHNVDLRARSSAVVINNPPLEERKVTGVLMSVIGASTNKL